MYLQKYETELFTFKHVLIAASKYFMFIKVVFFFCYRCHLQHSNRESQSHQYRFHGNGHLPGNGNGHAHMIHESRIAAGETYELDTYTPMLQENAHSDSKVSRH